MLTFNRAAETITGIAASERVGAPIVEILQLPRGLPARCSCPARADRRRSATSSASTAGTGATIEMGMTSAPLITPRGESGFLFTFQDVTELKKRDREARVQQRLAAVGEMAAGIAHEIRNPLASMAGSIQILRDELPLTADQSQLMDIVLRESDRLNETIRSFLSFAKPQRAAVADVDVRQILTDAARLLENNAEVTERARDRRGRAGRAGRSTAPTRRRSGRSSGTWRPTGCARCRAAGSSGCRAATPPAAAAAPKSSSAWTTKASASRPRTSTASSSPSAAASPTGTGLGLSIVHRIASDYGGEVRVASEQGKGTTRRGGAARGNAGHRVPVGDWPTSPRREPEWPAS